VDASGDLNMPGRLGAHYIDEHSQKRTPVMLHRAIFGSLERFFAILLEHHAGRLPAWLAPVQAVILTITDRQNHYVQGVAETLKKQGFASRATCGTKKWALRFALTRSRVCLTYWSRATRK